MLVAVVPEVRHEFVDVLAVGLEGATRREMYVANDLVNADTPRDVAALICLFTELVCPTFLPALQTQGGFGARALL